MFCYLNNFLLNYIYFLLFHIFQVFLIIIHDQQHRKLFSDQDILTIVSVMFIAAVIYTHTHTHTHIYTNSVGPTPIHIYTYTHIHTHIHIRTHH